MENAAKLISSAILGMNYKTVVINSHRYVIEPPTIKKIAGASYYLSDIKDAHTIGELIANQTNLENVAHALSFFIKGDDSIYEELSNATIDELVTGLSTAYELISVKPFMMLSALARSVANLTAKQRP